MLLAMRSICVAVGQGVNMREHTIQLLKLNHVDILPKEAFIISILLFGFRRRRSSPTSCDFSSELHDSTERLFRKQLENAGVYR